MSTADKKADNNIFKVIDQIRQLQMQSANKQNIKYKIGHLPIGSDEELNILTSLQAKGIIKILNSYGSDSSR
jgi:hypothetical protein